MPDPIAKEALEAYARFVAERDRIDSGDSEWSALAEFFTEDAVYIDPAWGRIEGREAIRDFFVHSMEGLTGHGWTTPENWATAEGARVIGQWDQILGEQADGTPIRVPGLSILYYAGDGLFCYSHDMLNMAHINEMLRAIQWAPPAEFNMPPREPNRDISLPKAWSHLEASR
ncbi:MAG: nuclear transport factor 2 family protein [Deltaproteobacteria bacterium]|nr:nuclear transport factor 2 family protein [Deltaproteobacteria bacterium]MBW2396321.1 nuclear transport factor 2 family protein [Deltaproteobacteria bacterium]